MKTIPVTLLSALLVVGTQAQIPGFGFGLDGRGGFNFSNPVFSGSFTPTLGNTVANSVNRISRLASSVGDLTSQIPNFLPTPPRIPNPLNAFGRFFRRDSSDVNVNGNANYNGESNVNDNSNGVVNTIRSGIDGVRNQIPQVPGFGSFIGNGINNVNENINKAFKSIKSKVPQAPDIGSLIKNSNKNLNDNINNAFNSITSGIDSVRNQIPHVPDFTTFIKNFENLWKPIRESIGKSAQQIPISPAQIFNQINQFLPGVTQAMQAFANFTRTASRSDIWQNLTSAAKRDVQNRIQSLQSDFEDMTSAMQDMMQHMPDVSFGAELNSTLRNQPFFFPNRTGIVHLFEWKFDDIADECEKFLGPNGYGGVQVSPINEYLVSDKRPWWERYQPVSYVIKSRSGDEKQFSTMVKRCLKAGVRVYVDVVVNHMAAPGVSVPLYGTAGSTCDPEILEFPAVPFNKTHFHEACVINDYQNASNVRNCELSSLPDLDQSNSFVRQKIVEFMNHLIDLGVAGFRMDACKHMSPEDLKVIYDSLKPLNPMYFFPPLARPFIYQEVIDLGTEAVTASEYTNLGVVTEFHWCHAVGDIFRGNIVAPALEMLTKNGSTGILLPSSQALVFVDNHDNQRGHGAGGDSVLTYKTKQQYIQAVAFTLATDYGIARVMSSYDFTDSDQGPPQDSLLQVIKSPGTAADGSCTNGWVCEHRWPEIRRMISFRNYVSGTSLDHIQFTNETFAFCRGEKGFIVFNNSEEQITKTFHTCLPKGQYCDIISGEPTEGRCSGTVISVDDNGDATITLEKNSVVAIYLLSKIS